MRSVRALQLQEQPSQPSLSNLSTSNITASVPTPVIVRPERQTPFRSTVISPNPERALYSTIEIPSTRYFSAEDKPVDFSARGSEAYRAENTGYAIGLAIAV